MHAGYPSAALALHCRYIRLVCQIIVIVRKSGRTFRISGLIFRFPEGTAIPADAVLLQLFIEYGAGQTQKLHTSVPPPQ